MAICGYDGAKGAIAQPIENTMWGGKFVLPVKAKVTKITVYIYNETSAKNVSCAIHLDVAGTPENSAKVSSQEVEVSATNDGWVDFAVAKSEPALDAGTYWIMVMAELDELPEVMKVYYRVFVGSYKVGFDVGTYETPLPDIDDWTPADNFQMNIYSATDATTVASVDIKVAEYQIPYGYTGYFGIPASEDALLSRLLFVPMDDTA